MLASTVSAQRGHGSVYYWLGASGTLIVSRLREKRDSSLTARDQSRQHLAAAVYPPAKLRRRAPPILLVDASPKHRRLQASRPEVEGEVHDGREPPLGLGGQHRAVAQRRIQRRHEVCGKVALGLNLPDRRVLRIAEMASSAAIFCLACSRVSIE